MLRLSRVLICFTLAATPLATLQAEAANTPTTAWNRANNPFLFDRTYNGVLEQLPLAGKLDVTPWTGWHWENLRGGIAVRWNSSNARDFSYPLNTREQLRKMSPAELAELSPAEKYDIYVGRYDYPTVRKVWSHTRKYNGSFDGLCHGAAPAAANTLEPAPVTVLNRDGIAIPFGSGDVKALLAYYYGWISNSRVRQLGVRCNYDPDKNAERMNDPNCQDINAGAFHVIVTNQIGIKKQPFITETYRGHEVWNYPVFEFEAQIKPAGGEVLPPQVAPGTVKRMVVEIYVTHAEYLEPRWEPNGDTHTKPNRRLYVYYLDVDAKGKILGGEWIVWDRPDFIWIKDKAEFSGYFSGIKEIYRPVATSPAP